MSFYDTGGEGSVCELTNAAGTVTDSYDYDAFGNSIATSGSTPNNYLRPTQPALAGLDGRVGLPVPARRQRQHPDGQ
jgi:hypothetical protein